MFDIALLGDCLDLLPDRVLDAVESLSFVNPLHVIEEPLFVLSHLLEHLHFFPQDDFLQRVHLEVVAMGKVEAQSGCLLHCLAKIARL